MVGDLLGLGSATVGRVPHGSNQQGGSLVSSIPNGPKSAPPEIFALKGDMIDDAESGGWGLFRAPAINRRGDLYEAVGKRIVASQLPGILNASAKLLWRCTQYPGAEVTSSVRMGVSESRWKWSVRTRNEAAYSSRSIEAVHIEMAIRVLRAKVS